MPARFEKEFTEIGSRCLVLIYGLHRYEAFADFEQGRWLGTDLERVFLAKSLFFVSRRYAPEPKVQLPLLSAQSFSRCYSAKDLIKFLGIIWYADLDSRLNSFTCRVFLPAGWRHLVPERELDLTVKHCN